MAKELKAESKANQIIEAFKAALARAAKDKNISQLLIEVNLSPEGSIGRCYFRTQAEIK